MIHRAGFQQFNVETHTVTVSPGGVTANVSCDVVMLAELRSVLSMSGSFLANNQTNEFLTETARSVDYFKGTVPRVTVSDIVCVHQRVET